MSSLFGQVWLWSLLSFVAGVALTWLVLVRPAKRELEDLEERLLTSPRPASAPTSSSVAGGSVGPTPAPRDEFDNWHVDASRSLADDVLSSEPARYEAERTRYEAREPSRYDSAVEAPRYDVANMKLDQRDSLLEELDDEHRPLSDFEEQHDFPEYEPEPPRSLFERLAPEGGQDTRQDARHDTRHDTRQDTRETLEPRPRQYGPDDEPELPAEETTHLMPVVPAGPVADVAPPQPEPTAPPEVAVFQPREVWREEPVQEVYDQDEVTDGHEEEEDEPERRPVPVEETALIPATALAEAIAEVDREQRQPEFEPQVWPEHDLTGHFSPVDVESTRGELAEEPRDGGPQTEVIRAVVDSAPVESKPEVVEPEPAAEPEPPRAPEPAAAVEPEVPAEPEVPVQPEMTVPEPVQPPPFEPTFVQPAERVEPKPAEPKPAEPKAAEPKPEPQAAEPKPEPKKDEPARPRSLFEPLPDTGDEPQPEPEQVRRPPQPVGNDQPFVPTLSPELLAGNPTPLTANGLPQRPTRPSGAPRTPSPAPLAPKPVTPPPPPPRPVRPRPVGFSPSTGGRPAPGSTRFQGQPEGFNPRSPFGPGSVLPKSDGLAPAPEFQVKATLTGRRYFTNESANFRETRADVWFRTTADAEKAGFRQAP